MRAKKDIRELFEKGKQADFDFSQSPDFIRRKEESAQQAKLFEKGDLSRWARTQRGLMHFTKVKSIFSKEYVETGVLQRDSFFRERGGLKGNVLDIGGGWGLYRQWWKPEVSDVYFVHDPGIERYLRGAHKIHHDYYQRAFSLPMTFVEGFGEELPYENEVFDTCLIADSLDHFVEPEKVLAEAYRCLQSASGAVLILQKCDAGERSRQPNILKRLLKNLRNPRRFLSKIYHWLFYKGHHLHHFSSEDIVTLLEQAGFSKVQVTGLAKAKSIYAFEANRGPLDCA